MFQNKYDSYEHLRKEAIKEDVALIDGEWLVGWWKGKRVVPCRQELPKGAVFDPTKMNEYNSETEQVEGIEIVVISYPWITPQHPDPTGFHLHLVAQTIEMFLRFENGYYHTGDYDDRRETTEEEKLAFDQKEKKVKVVVFWDWMSCYQNYYPNTSSPPRFLRPPHRCRQNNEDGRTRNLFQKCFEIDERLVCEQDYN